MKEISFIKPQGMDSLGRKLALVVFIVIMVTGLTAGYLVTVYQEQVLLNLQQDAIKLNTLRYSSHLTASLIEKQKKALVANKIVERALSKVKLDAKPDIAVAADGTIRAQDEYSAAFIENTSFYTRRTAGLMEQTGLLWQQLGPLMTEDFYNYYFISKDRFMRSSPVSWALEINADHGFDVEQFFRPVMPENNPERIAKWTELYFDSIIKQWLISLVVPVYVDDEFIGVTGADMLLQDILDNLPVLQNKLQNGQVFLFDGKGQIIGDRYQRLPTGLAMSTLFTGVDGMTPALKSYAKQVALQTKEKGIVPNNLLPELLIYTAAIGPIDWHLSIYISKDEVLARLTDDRLGLISVFIVVALLVSLIILLIIYQMVLKRLSRLTSVIYTFSRGELSQIELDDKSDEIGVLNRTFKSMAEKISTLLIGLNAKVTEKELAEQSTRKLSKAVSFLSSGIVITDSNLKIEYINPFLIHILNCQMALDNKQYLSELFAKEMHHLHEEIAYALTERQHWRGDILLHYFGEKCWMSLAIAPIRDDKGVISNYVCAMQDISFIKQSQIEMEQLAYYDVLTGLANRCYFREQLRKAIAMSQRGYYNFALLYFDLDEFKRINDTLGHDAGDELLKEVSRRLTSRLRAEDTIARLGGDEFAVILAAITDRNQASIIARSLQQAFAEPVKLGQHEVSISASIGITIAPEDAANEELLLKHADLAMYEAKARGRNTFHFFSPDLNEAAEERLLIENQLREAIKHNQFILYYQPKMDLRDNCLVGYEALIRWLRPDNTLVPPIRFIGVAESTGLIVQIGEWIIWEACRFLARQHSKGHLVTLAINLSVRQFKDQSLPEVVERIIQRTGVDAKYLSFEITESMLMGDTDAAISQLNQLKRLGVSLSIDDFGTGYSSLSYLKRFPVDELKIDRSFVCDIPDNRNDMNIVAAIIAMAQKMNLQVVAEGVETAEQVEFLRKNACYYVQGYYFSMPLAEQELACLNFAIKQ
ncbi:EAL domain-containing protein [Rheinheimera sp. MMS21-TC3]|uniref:bifunctional diguanylate cyclase/phosphodiesterase n=1 Tax=Rheinheimera sp. MMS21-TC3 TaxID=3072790 RepID=UPI0028C4E4B2|nr:EAL domain-containing protein [Rheinheimera sp. MMS21-TC3]WNO61485.1 EAL domain-containing protein [Rheinheimera sp. MMS21-TC3]